ncbi:MAG: HlyD family secretion protein [Bdellovibrionales bacterium]|nr:HlyD family secretion protein [Bdellovibrionales bacterium]
MNAHVKSSGSKRQIFTGVGIVVALGVGYLIYRHMAFVSTDNASVQAHSVMLSSKVSGLVLKVNVEENQKVKAGEVLAKIDDRDYVNTLHQVESEFESLQARVADTEKNYKRLSDLVKSGAVSRQQFDTAEATYKELSRKLGSVSAQLEQAKLNLSYTEIKAPSDGTVARKSIEAGMLAGVGQPLIGFVGADDRWIIANFKETEIHEIGIGKKAEIKVDAIADHNFEGEVESLSPSTGATFTMLPPDNATGNFTKVVQRVPVRIKFLNLTPQDRERLQAGLSADVSVRR